MAIHHVKYTSEIYVSFASRNSRRPERANRHQDIRILLALLRPRTSKSYQQAPSFHRYHSGSDLSDLGIHNHGACFFPFDANPWIRVCLVGTLFRRKKSSCHFHTSALVTCWRFQDVRFDDLRSHGRRDRATPAPVASSNRIIKVLFPNPAPRPGISSLILWGQKIPEWSSSQYRTVQESNQ